MKTPSFGKQKISGWQWAWAVVFALWIASAAVVVALFSESFSFTSGEFKLIFVPPIFFYQVGLALGRVVGFSVNLELINT